MSKSAKKSAGKMLGIRVTSELWEQVNTLARSRELTVTEYVRNLILDDLRLRELANRGRNDERNT
jgi:predicted DNA-binding ribbon-helix-helix protein